MPTGLPIIRGTSTALYPFVQAYTAQTSISDSQAGKTARCVKGPPLVHFELSYPQLSQSEKNTLKAALTSAKGQFATDRSLTTTDTFTNLSCDSDEFSALEQVSRQYGVRWNWTQTLPQNFSPGVSGGPYPVLGTTAPCVLPYTQKKRFQSIISKMPSGPKYTYAEFGAGLTDFPTDGLMAWEFNESVLTDAEVSAKIAHFLANWGDAFPFTFTDEDATVYNNVYYASPQLVITRNQPNQSSIHTVLVQMA